MNTDLMQMLSVPQHLSQNGKFWKLEILGGGINLLYPFSKPLISAISLIKIATLTFKALNTGNPPYLASLAPPAHPMQNLTIRLS